jgi:hypothetical protein
MNGGPVGWLKGLTSGYFSRESGMKFLARKTSERIQ